MVGYEDDGGLNLKATELRLGLPGRDLDENKDIIKLLSTERNNNKRSSPVTADDTGSKTSSEIKDEKAEEEEEDRSIAPPAPKAQVVGWPPVRSYRKNISFQQLGKKEEGGGGGGGMMIYVKVSMDGAPYLRKIDIKVYNGYPDLIKALETMFKMTIGDYSEREGYKGSEYAPTYEDKDGDWMLLGDVPWEMFMSTCKRMRIMKGSEIKGLGCVI
ncbi:auxin-induced protein IAA4-like [Impatiens glandulifera]|uniref:auxin-induced protein IAA4-like n=1 Tax=Impatiens glandulifera TaxID=253017 RepID=UPI001FB13EB0|nr:auxin-induced protein IAA4-like [Impatiens glandulifera]